MKSDWYYITSLGGNINLLEKIVKLGTKRGVKVALNPGSKEIAQGERLQNLLSRVEILLLNKDEALSLSGTESLDAAFDKLNQPTITAVTKGKEGSELRIKKTQYKAGIFSEKEFIDRTGAGDAFGSGFVSGYIKRGADPTSEQCLTESLRLGAANSTAIVEHLGAKAKILSTADFKDSRWKKEEFPLEINNLD
jgi:sugar/nucleoside kinase (ribokinase family)